MLAIVGRPSLAVSAPRQRRCRQDTGTGVRQLPNDRHQGVDLLAHPVEPARRFDPLGIVQNDQVGTVIVGGVRDPVEGIGCLDEGQAGDDLADSR